MAIGCGAQIVKIVLVLFNILVSLAGLALIVVGCWFLVDEKAVHFLGIASDHGTLHVVQTAAVILLIVGILSLLIGILGCWGAFRQKTSCLSIYAVIIALIILVQIVGAILVGVFYSKITRVMRHELNTTLQLDYGRLDTETKAWDLLQYELACCGVQGPADWQTSFWSKHNSTGNAPVPKTCCVLKNSNLSDPQPKNAEKCYSAVVTNSTSDEYLHHEGCETKLESWIGHTYVAIVIGIAIAIIAIEVIAVLLACFLRARIHSGYEYV